MVSSLLEGQEVQELQLGQEVQEVPEGSSHPFDPQAQCPPLAQVAPPHPPVGQV